MKYQPDIVGVAGLKFFGTISASISHELKNALAIINEGAGLLDDLVLMAKKGTPIDLPRIQLMAKKIQRQVSGADNILKNMNRFAHSIDTPVRNLDIHELLASLLELTSRLMGAKGIKTYLQPASSPVMITTAPFYLKNLLWCFLSFALEVVGDSKTVVMAATKSNRHVCIEISRLHGLSSNETEAFLGEGEKALIRMLNAKISFEANAGTIKIAIPSVNHL